MFHFGSNARAVRRVLTDVGFGRSMVNSAEWWAQILTRVRSRDEAAAAELVAALKPLVTRIVLTHLPREASADDLMQEVFMKVFSKLDQYAGVVPFEHWTSRVALNTCRDHLRARQRSREIRVSDLCEEEAAMLDAIAEENPSRPDSDHEGVAARDLAGKLLESLGPEDRIVVQMIDLEGRSAEEVRAVTGWSITGIRVRDFRARRKLRKTIEKLQKEGGR